MSDIKRAALLVPCESKEHLQDWLKVYLDFHIFDHTVSRFATSNPLDAMWEAYDFMINPVGRIPKSYLLAAARSTQKTISLGAFDILSILHAKRSLIHFAGTKDQIESGYSYVKIFLNKPYIRDLVDGEITANGTKLLIPDIDNQLWLDGQKTKDIYATNPDSVKQVNITVRSISPYSVQGAHTSCVVADELHTLKGEKRQAYKDIRKIPVADPLTGKPWIRIGISSRKNPTSVVEEEIETRDKTGLILRQWTVFEGVEQCPASKNGGDFVHERYINVYDGVVKTVDEYNLYDGKDKDKYSNAKLASGCLTCPIFTACQGDLAKPKPFNKHHQSVEAAIVDFISDADRQWYIAQCLSLQPSRQGIVFSNFNRNDFYVTPNQMYKRFTGTEANRTLTNEELIAFMLKSGVKARAGVDHGFTDPMAVVIVYEDSSGTEYIMKVVSISGLDPNKATALVRDLWHKYKFTELFPDTASPAINALFKLLKLFKVKDDFDKKDGIADGIALIRGKISPMDLGETKFIGLEGECEPLVVEMEKYSYMQETDGKYTDIPEDEYNHTIDALRYLAINRWKKKKNLVMANDPQSPTKLTEQTEKDKYNEAVKKTYENWMSTEIKTTIQEAGGHVGVQSSKNKGVLWDID